METTVIDVPESDRFEIRDGDRVLGMAAYQRRGDTVVFTHTEVDPDAGQSGLGSTLVRAALDEVRSHGGSVEGDTFEVEGMGRGAYIRDSENNMVGLWQDTMDRQSA